MTNLKKLEENYLIANEANREASKSLNSSIDLIRSLEMAMVNAKLMKAQAEATKKSTIALIITADNAFRAAKEAV